MRRSDREIKDFDEILKVLEKCDVCRLAFNDGDYPYIVPMSFALEYDGSEASLYFHSANEGKKLELIAKDNRASFEADCSHGLVFDEEKGNCTTEYESVAGRGRITFITDEKEKMRVLKLLVSHYRKEGFAFGEAAVPLTTVFRLHIESVTGKRRMK